MSKKPKVAKSKIELLDKDGAPMDSESEDALWENAYGVRVTQLSNGKFVDLLHGDNEAANRMLANFGRKTLAGHVASQVRQKSGDDADATPAIAERFELIDNGKWVDRTREAFAYDQPQLATAACDVMVAAGQIDESQRATVHANLLQKMAENEKFPAQVAAVEGVRDRYNELIGKVVKVKTAADLLAMVK